LPSAAITDPAVTVTVTVALRLIVQPCDDARGDHSSWVEQA